MYMTRFGSQDVVKVSSSGVVTAFATTTGGPTGILVTQSGHILVSDYTLGKVYDITAGGSFASAPVFATVNGAHNLVQLPNGQILVASLNDQKVYDITSGSPVGFANGFTGVAAIAALGSEVYATDFGRNAVFDITAGGNVNVASLTPFANVTKALGLATTSSDLYVSQQGGTNIYKITAGGNFISATPFASNFGTADSEFGAVPLGPVPEPSTLLLAGFALTALAARRKTLAQQKR